MRNERTCRFFTLLLTTTIITPYSFAQSNRESLRQRYLNGGSGRSAAQIRAYEATRADRFQMPLDPSMRGVIRNGGTLRRSSYAIRNAPITQNQAEGTLLNSSFFGGGTPSFSQSGAGGRTVTYEGDIRGLGLEARQAVANSSGYVPQATQDAVRTGRGRVRVIFNLGRNSSGNIQIQSVLNRVPETASSPTSTGGGGGGGTTQAPVRSDPPTMIQTIQARNFTGRSGGVRASMRPTTLPFQLSARVTGVAGADTSLSPEMASDLRAVGQALYNNPPTQNTGRNLIRVVGTQSTDNMGGVISLRFNPTPVPVSERPTTARVELVESAGAFRVTLPNGRQYEAVGATPTTANAARAFHPAATAPAVTQFRSRDARHSHHNAQMMVQTQTPLNGVRRDLAPFRAAMTNLINTPPSGVTIDPQVRTLFTQAQASHTRIFSSSYRSGEGPMYRPAGGPGGPPFPTARMVGTRNDLRAMLGQYQAAYNRIRELNPDIGLPTL